MHENDTLQGMLVNSEWEHEDEKHLRNKFGYWRMVEKRMIRAVLTAEGMDPNSVEFHLEIAKQVDLNHKNDLSLRERQEADRIARGPQPKIARTWFTEEEIVNLLDRYEGANDPISQAILAKLRSLTCE